MASKAIDTLNGSSPAGCKFSVNVRLDDPERRAASRKESNQKRSQRKKLKKQEKKAADGEGQGRLDTSAPSKKKANKKSKSPANK